MPICKLFKVGGAVTLSRQLMMLGSKEKEGSMAGSRLIGGECL
jgi:hypothetical protein